ncbi:hypothetical protein [Brevibacterium marinum]|uniref:Uncharacterized protein n=1 Tax=Brevibacterium marinum TaxID=418643 RepID=A0A846RYA4_9MICO|nr:hypothetical protein [Brevibacterium marinum]NJC55858.1 hypothetical protein [Brevibacterium marinum]
MLTRWKIAIVTGLFVVGALSFLLGLFPTFAGIFWILWFTGCGACILALVLTVLVPTHRPAVSRPVASRSAVRRSVTDPPVTGGPAADSATGSADGVSRP